MNIGILQETKTPPDRRVALTPQACNILLQKFPQIQIHTQKSSIRCFTDKEYELAGLPLTQKLNTCQLLIGVKEVEIDALIPDKTYMFFAHVAKKQVHNKKLLQEIIKRRITLIDYEYLTNQHGQRIIAFGRWAGIVGAYNAVRAIFKKQQNIDIPAAEQLGSYKYMQKMLSKQKMPPVKIVITGNGRVASGAVEIMDALHIKKAAPNDFLHKTYQQAVYCQLSPLDYVIHTSGKNSTLQHFFSQPNEYSSRFAAYTRAAHTFIACHFWDPASPHFITQNDLNHPQFSLSIIADISCDVPGPLAPTLRVSTIASPYYDVSALTLKEQPAFSGNKNITVMAVDNLPGSLPRDASDDFSYKLVHEVLPHFFNNDPFGVIQRATITKNGKLTPQFSYLNSYVRS